MDWDAATYDRIADPMTRWGTDVLDRLPLRGDETVLDAGCGSGRVTERLVDRLPRGRVVALDGSPAMVEAARERLAAVRRPGELRDRGPGGAAAARATRASTRSCPRRPSTGSRDHEALFRHLASVAAARRAAGRAVRRAGQHRRGPGRAGRGGRRLAGAVDLRLAGGRRRGGSRPPGSSRVKAWLTDEPTPIEPGAPLREYLRTVILGAHLERLPAADRAAFVEAVATRLPTSSIDYVRLNILATRRGAAGGRPSRLATRPERRAVPGDHDVRGREHARPAPLDGRLVVAQRVHVGRPVLVPPEVGHRVHGVVGLRPRGWRPPRCGPASATARRPARGDSRRRRGRATGRRGSGPRSRPPRRSGTARS